MMDVAEGPWLGTSVGLSPELVEACEPVADRRGGIRERRLRAHGHIAGEQHAVDEDHGIPMRVVGAHRIDLRLDAAKVNGVVPVKYDVGVAMLRALQQLDVERRTLREHRHEVHAGAGRDVFDLVLRADEFRFLRESMRTHVVLGMHVGRDDVDRFARGHLGDFTQHSFAIARAHAGVDDQHGFLADHDADVGDQRRRAVRDSPDVGCEFLGDALAHERGGAGCWARAADVRNVENSNATLRMISPENERGILYANGKRPHCAGVRLNFCR
jgi:hypothetical protein